MYLVRLPRKRHYFEAPRRELDMRDKLVDKSLHKQQHLRIFNCVFHEVTVPHPAESLTFKIHDVSHVYEAIFLASRDYTSARIQNTVETPSYTVRAYSAVYFICWLLSAHQLDQGSAPAVQRNLKKHVSVLVLNELTHLIPCMFTQVVLLANDSGKLAETSMASLQYADAAASKVPGWPPLHPVRRILSNLVILGQSEDPRIISQVAENARKCVLETCNNKGIRSAACSDQGGRRRRHEGGNLLQKGLPSTTLEKDNRVDTARIHRVGSSLHNKSLQSSSPLESEKAEGEARGNSKYKLQHDDESKHVNRQLDTDICQSSTSGIGDNGYRANVHNQGQLSTAANNTNASTACAFLEQVNTDSLGNQLSESDLNLETPPAQQVEHVTTNQQDDCPHQTSENVVLFSKGTSDEMGTLDHFRLYIEHIFGLELDWRPMPPIKRPIGVGQSRISWTVSTYMPKY